ncbi:hypothetical protein ACFORG_06270 [Lutimaribacter marinistellae]|uniref:HEAT repeat domain-containing protein n=1 Tax=Lutimaribacter marinistellae TaxID=1820329 RepID=A0ABV7TGY9_9RHOB
MSERFADMLSGGHPNSLGRTVEVVETVLVEPARIDELFNCYRSSDEVVRLRVSNALRRVQAERPDLILPLMDQLIDEIGNLDQPSAQWTLPKLFEGAQADLTPKQALAALTLVKRNLAQHDDWIVLNNSIEYLARLARTDPDLADWLRPHLTRLACDTRKSVAKRASRHLDALSRG